MATVTSYLLTEDGDFLLTEDGWKIIVSITVDDGTYKVNSLSSLSGVHTTWQKIPKRVNADGTIDFTNWAVHTWEMQQMEMREYEELQGIAGTTLTQIQTNDIDNRNVAATYTTAEVAEVNCRQQGRRALGVRLEFRVDTTS